nr:E-beta-farnesene synthase [Tanacetum cinerariifolium]
MSRFSSTSKYMSCLPVFVDVLVQDALVITPIDQAHQFVSPPSGDAVMDFVNQLGYTEVIYFVSRMAVNNLYQPWRAILSMINQCLTGKTSGHDRPRYPRSTSSFHPAEEDLRLGNLKFVPKGNVDDVFRMPIPNELISNNIRNASYYNAYLKIVAKHDQKSSAEKEGTKKTASAKQPKPMPAIVKSTKPAPAPNLKETKERLSKASTAKPPKPKPAKKLVDEPDEEPAQSEPEPELEHQGEEATQPLPVVEGKGKAIVTEEQAAHSLLALYTPKRRSTMDQFIFQRRTSAIEASLTGPSAQAQDDLSANIVRDSPSFIDAKTGATSEKTNSGGDTKILQIDEEKGNDVDKQVVMDEDQARLDPGESRGALARPDPEPTHDEFMTDMYPKVQESLKFTTDEHVILEDPISSTGTFSSMRNLEDAYVVGDQFINNKSTKDEPKKPNVEAKVVSMVTVPIYQASSSVPPLSTSVPVNDLSPPKHASSTTQAPIFTATTTTLLPPLQQQKQKNKTLDNTSRNLGSKVFNLDLRDLPHKINEAVRESVREAVHVAHQVPLRDRFRELPEANMKEILHQRMFKTGTYKSLPEHVALYEALEASMEHANKDKLFTKMDKSRKRRPDD